MAAGYPASVFTAATRGVALFLGVFGIVNVLGDLRFARANTNVWWLDLWPLPIPLARLVMAGIAAALISYALRPDARRGRGLRQALVLLAAAAAVLNAIGFYVALAKHEMHTSLPVPLSAIVALVLIAIAIEHGRSHEERPVALAAAALGAAFVFPVLQVCFFGLTDYRRPAEAIVVFGARANADGTPSDALADRVRTACSLYRAGFAPRIIMSGGPGAGQASEPQVMRALAQRLGVPAAAIIEDPAGVNTEATVQNTMRILSAPPARVLAVSHFYHLPRIKLAYQRRSVEAFTVPSEDTVPWSMPFNLMRETAAFWWYYLRDVARA